MATVRKPCACCNVDCCLDATHPDLLPSGAMVTLPDIVPSTYPPGVWTTIYTATIKSGRTVGLNPVFVDMGSSCDFYIKIRAKYTDKCSVRPPSTPCSGCILGRVYYEGERALTSWWCDGVPRSQGHAGYPAATVLGSSCTYRKIEWQVLTSYRPTVPQAVKNYTMRCEDAPVLHDFGTLVIPITSSMTIGEYTLATTGLIALPSLCTWRMRWTTKVMTYFNFSGSFGASSRKVTAWLKLISFLQSPSSGCNCGTGICTYGSYALAFDTTGPPLVDPTRCFAPPGGWWDCPDGCFCHPLLYSFHRTMCASSVGLRLVQSPIRTRTIRPPPNTGYCAIWALEKCTCPDDQLIEIAAGYTVT